MNGIRSFRRSRIFSLHIASRCVAIALQSTRCTKLGALYDLGLAESQASSVLKSIESREAHFEISYLDGTKIRITVPGCTASGTTRVGCNFPSKNSSVRSVAQSTLYSKNTEGAISAQRRCALIDHLLKDNTNKHGQLLWHRLSCDSESCDSPGGRSFSCLSAMCRFGNRAG